MTAYIDTSDYFGQIITGITTNITGSLFFTLLAVIVLICLIALALRIPVLFTAIILMPILIASASITSEFLNVFILFLIYFGFILADLLRQR